MFFKTEEVPNWRRVNKTGSATTNCPGRTLSFMTSIFFRFLDNAKTLGGGGATTTATEPGGQALAWFTKEVFVFPNNSCFLIENKSVSVNEQC